MAFAIERKLGTFRGWRLVCPDLHHAGEKFAWERTMDMTTILIIVVVLLILGGGGYYGFRRRG